MEDNKPQPRFGGLPIQLDPQSADVLSQRIAMPLRTTIPTHTPAYDGVHEVYFDGVDYWLYIWANGAWRSQKLGVAGATPGGSDTQVQFNDSGALGGDAGMTYNKTTNALSVDRIKGNTGVNLTIEALDGAASGNAGKALILNSGEGNGAANAGFINIIAGDGGNTSGEGGSIAIEGGTGGGGTSRGGDVFISGGLSKGVARGGDAQLSAGNADSATGEADGGDVFVAAGRGDGATGDGGHAFLTAGGTDATNGDGGKIFIESGGANGSGNGGDIFIDAGSGDDAGGRGGNLSMHSGFKGTSDDAGEVIIKRGINLWAKTGMDTMTYANPLTLDVEKHSLHFIIADDIVGDATINASAGGSPGQVIYVLIQDASGAGRTITFGTHFLTPGGATIVGSPATYSLIAFISDGTQFYEISRTLLL